MAENSEIAGTIDSDRTLDEIAQEIQALRSITLERSKKANLEIEKLKKQLIRAMWVFGSLLVVAIFLRGMLTNSNINDLKNEQQLLTTEIESLKNDRVTAEQITTLENQISSLREEIKELGQKDSNLPELFPENLRGNEENNSLEKN